MAGGRWDLFVEGRDGTLTRLTAGLCDTRNLVGGGDNLNVWIPYATDKDNLSIRVWQRSQHAVVDHMDVGTDDTHVAGRLVEAGAASTVTAALAESRSGRSAEAQLTSGDGRFRMVVDHGRLAATGEDIWDLWLRTAEGEPIRVGFPLDDIAEPSEVAVYPAWS
ncbi:hypothetical protein ACFQ0B_77175 [Nonomuraea thailandensis]